MPDARGLGYHVSHFASHQEFGPVMRIFGLGLPELLIILAIVCILFGPVLFKKINKQVKATGKAAKKGIENGAKAAGSDVDLDRYRQKRRARQGRELPGSRRQDVRGRRGRRACQDSRQDLRFYPDNREGREVKRLMRMAMTMLVAMGMVVPMRLGRVGRRYDKLAV